MAIKSFIADRPPAAGDGKRLGSWSLSAGAVALVVELCNGTAATPMIQIQVPVNSSAAQVYAAPCLPIFPLGLHVEIVTGNLNRGSIDI